MPYAQINGAKFHYLDEGAGADTVVFSHGLLMSADMFAAQVEALKGSYRCIAFDHRGQGKSAVTESGYDMETLAEDAAGLIESLGVAPCHFVGLSMGGFVGMRLAARRPELLRSLTLIETSAEPEDKANVPRYRLLNFIARWFGLRLVVSQVMPIMFGQTFLNDPDRRQEKALWRERLAANDRIGITRAVKGVVEPRRCCRGDRPDRHARPHHCRGRKTSRRCRRNPRRCTGPLRDQASCASPARAIHRRSRRRKRSTARSGNS